MLTLGTEFQGIVDKAVGYTLETTLCHSESVDISLFELIYRLRVPPCTQSPATPSPLLYLSVPLAGAPLFSARLLSFSTQIPFAYRSLESIAMPLFVPLNPSPAIPSYSLTPVAFSSRVAVSGPTSQNMVICWRRNSFSRQRATLAAVLHCSRSAAAHDGRVQVLLAVVGRMLGAVLLRDELGPLHALHVNLAVHPLVVLVDELERVAPSSCA